MIISKFFEVAWQGGTCLSTPGSAGTVSPYPIVLRHQKCSTNIICLICNLNILVSVLLIQENMKEVLKIYYSMTVHRHEVRSEEGPPEYSRYLGSSTYLLMNYISWNSVIFVLITFTDILYVYKYYFFSFFLIWLNFK